MPRINRTPIPESVMREVAEEIVAAERQHADADRCTNCDHRARFHSEGGCWFTVTNGRGNLVCPCTVRADHPHTDPGDGRTECETCGKYVFPVTHSCKGVPVTARAKARRERS